MKLHLFPILNLEFINEIRKSEFGNDVFMQDDCSYSKGHVVEIAKIQTWMNRHYSSGLAARLNWINFLDGDELLYVPCSCLNLDVVWMTLKFLSILRETDVNLQYCKSEILKWKMAHQVACSDCRLVLNDAEMNEIRDMFFFESFDHTDLSDACKPEFAYNNTVVTSATSEIHLDELDFQIRDMLDGQISPTLDWSQCPCDEKIDSEIQCSVRNAMTLILVTLLKRRLTVVSLLSLRNLTS